MTTPTVQRKVYSREQAAEAYGVGIKDISNAIRSGALKAKQPGRKYLISEAALEEWFAGLRDAS